jgi:hypothetical protein
MDHRGGAVAAKKRIVVAGSGGVFGTHLLAALGDAYDVVATTRATLDLGDVDAVARAARGAFVFACAAGPFQQLDRAIVRAVVNEGAHWLDIADDERWFFDLLDDRELDVLARARGVVVMPGLSTLPAISCALVRRILPAERVRITLFIGADNAKGAAAIASGAALHTPDRELLRRELGVETEVRTRFEVPGAALALRALRILPLRARLRIARVLARLMPRFGSTGGFVEVRRLGSGGSGHRDLRESPVAEAATAPQVRGSRAPQERVVLRGAQNMAVLPLVFALEHLEGRSGCLSPTVFDPEELLQFVT